MSSRRAGNKQLFIRRVQYWLKQHEYESGYGIKLYKCGVTGYALCRNGVVDAVSGGAVVLPWKDFTLTKLKQLFARVKKQCLEDDKRQLTS